MPARAAAVTPIMKLLVVVETYLSRGYVEPGIAMPVMLGALAGSILVARQLIGARVRVLRWTFAIVVAAMAIEMIVSALRGS